LEQQGFYERFWEDSDYTFRYAFDAAVRERYPAILKVWSGMRMPERVLDFGCGNGVLSYWMYCNGFGTAAIKGVDISETGVLQAQRNFARPGLDFEVNDLSSDGGQDAPYDVVVSSHVLEHVPNPGSTLERLLPLAEWFVLEVPLEKCAVQTLRWRLRGQSQSANALGHVNFWRKHEFRSFVEAHGLVIVKDYQYASAPFSPYNGMWKRRIERAMLGVLGLSAYSRVMATHYAVLARRRQGAGGAATVRQLAVDVRSGRS
jgi:SAM-dependent methyltransferase